MEESFENPTWTLGEIPLEEITSYSTNPQKKSFTEAHMGAKIIWRPLKLKPRWLQDYQNWNLSGQDRTRPKEYSHKTIELQLQWSQYGPTWAQQGPKILNLDIACLLDLRSAQKT